MQKFTKIKGLKILGLSLFIFLFGLVFFITGPNVLSSGGVTPDYLSEMEGMNIMMMSSSTVYGIGKFTIYDTSANTLTSLVVTLEDLSEVTGFDPSVDLATLSSGATSSGMSLWRDDGDGQFNSATDTLAPTLSSSWTTVGSSSQATFSGINWAFSGNMKVFLAFMPANIATSSAKGFNVIVEDGDMSFSGGTFNTWPYQYNHFFPPVWIGEAGAGGWGTPFVISEIQTGTADTNDEFIEIYNRAPQTMDLGGWILKFNPASVSGSFTWPTTLHFFSTSSPHNLQPGGFYLAGYGFLSTTSDVTMASGHLSEAGGYVGLFDPMGDLMDWVGYGTLDDYTLTEGGQAAYAPAATGSIERKAFSDSTYSKMSSGGIHENMGNNEDSNNNAMDFIMRSIAEPQNSSSTPEFPMGDMGGNDIILNEIYYKTSSNDGWIELYNRTDSNKSLNNFKIRHKNYEYILPNIQLNSYSYLVVKWNQGSTNATGTTGYDYLETGTMGAYLDTYGGDVMLLDETSAIMDYVEFGGSGYHNESNAVSSGQWMTGDYVPHCLFNDSIGRKSTDGEDWNDSDDWQTFSTPSPGSPNMGGDSTAPTVVASVTLADNDGTLTSGLDGRDITVVWTPSTTADPSFDRYEIFLLPDGTQLDFSTHQPIDSIYSGQYQYSSGTPLSTYTYTGGTFITKDSADTALTTGSYRAYVIAFDFSDNKSGTAQSVAATLTSEAYSSDDDNTAPFIMHMGVWFAYTGQDIHLMARFQDDRQMATTSPAQVIWKAGSSTSTPDLTFGTTITNCTYLDAGFYDCIIPWNGGWNTNTRIGYYLKGKDAASTPNYAYISSLPDADMTYVETNVRDYPFFIDINSAPVDDGNGASDFSGVTYSWDGNILSSTTVFFEGMSLAPITTNASGTFVFADDSIDHGMYHVIAFKDGYMDMSNTVYRGDTFNFYLNEGDMNMSGGSGGGNPFVMWTAPNDNMSGAPIDIFCTGDCSSVGGGETPVVIAFDRPMNANTVNDQNAADSGSNIYLTTNGVDRVAGKVYYDSNMEEARFYAGTNNSLSLGTYYSIIVTQGVTDESGNPISGMNSDGSFSNGFTTIMSTSTNTDNFGTGGATMPPYVMGTTPFPGQFNVPRGASVILEFSEAMDSSKINTDTIKLFRIINSSTWEEGVTAVAAAVSLDQATKRIVTLNPDTDLAATSSWWVIKVMGDARSSAGFYMADPYGDDPAGCADWNVCSELSSVTAYQSNFKIDIGAVDTTKPTVMGTYPNDGDGISNNSSVYVGIGAIEIGFSEAMDPSTINSENIKLLAGTYVASGKVSYDTTSNSAKYMPYSALLSNTQYMLRIITACTDLSGNLLDATTSVYFKTGASDTALPEVMYANGDDYSIALTYTEPMNVANQTDTVNWAYSVLNPANYAINGLTFTNPQSCSGSWSCGVNLIGSYNGATGTVLTGLGLSFGYEEYNNTVIIEGFQFDPSTTDFQIFVDNVRDKSNNTISDNGNRAADNSHLNAARAPLYSSTDTYGALGPGATDYTMDMGDMGMMMAGVWPMNAMAGQSSMYFIDIPTTKSIPIGGKIIITFPSGFDVSSAAKDPYSPINNDINEWNAGVVTIDSVSGNQSTRAITIVASTTATQLTDYLHMDIKGIVNASIPKDFGTDGYNVDIKTFTADGALLETIYTMPFFITEGGSLAISGSIHGVASGHNGTTTIYLGSPMTGHMEVDVGIAGDGGVGADGTYSFTNLADGEYFIFTEPSITLGSNTYFGNPNPEPIWLNGASSTKDITLMPEASGGALVVVSLTGDFTTGSTADDVDIFAGSPSGFRVKTLSSVGNVSGATTSLYLSSGDWMIGIGSAMPMGPMSGPPPMPDWMPPMNVYYSSDGSTPGAVSFNISGQTAYTISGTVIDGSSNGIADAEVYAYQAMGGFGGSHTKTATDGTFSLKIPVTGTYKVGAFKPGLPEPKERVVEVSANVPGITIKMIKPDYTISGKILNSSGNAVPYAPVWTWQENGWGHSNTMSDASGNYILYVNPGVWHVEADAPGIGWMEYGLLITISDASAANINIQPNASISFYTISGKVGIDTDGDFDGDYTEIETPFTNMPIRAAQFDANSVYQGKEFNSMTNSNGEYSITVPAGIYRVDIWTQEYGELGVNNQSPLNNTLNEVADDDYSNNPANVNATVADVANADIIVVQNGLRNIYITVANAPDGQEGFLNIEGVNFAGAYPEPTGFRLSRRVDDISATTTLSLPDGDYFFFLDVPGYGSYIPDDSDRHATKDDIEVTATTTVNFTMPDQSSGVVTVSGTVYSPSIQGGNELGNAWVWIGDPNTGYHNGAQTASTGVYSLIVPTGSGYKIGADKPGYMSNEPSDIDCSSDVAGQNIVLTSYTLTISGYIYNDADSSNSYTAGEGVPSGFVRAETTQCADSDTTNDASCQRAHAPVDSTGYYSLGVVNGTWKVYAMADGYAETYYGATISISGSSAGSKHIKLTADANWTSASKMKPITPASGGTMDDTTASGTGIKLTIPPNALGNSSASGNVNAQKTAAVTKTNSSEPVGGQGVNITATDNSGQAITNLDDYVDIEMVLYKAEIDATIAAEKLTYEKLKNTENKYWDSSMNDWVSLTTSRSAYYSTSSVNTNWILYANAATTSEAFVAFINELASGTLNPADYKLVYTSKTNHLSIFAIIMPFIAVAAQAAPPADPPADPPSGGGGGSFIRYCTEIEYDEWQELCIGDWQYRNVLSQTPLGCTPTTAQEADRTRACQTELLEIETTADTGEVAGETAEEPGGLYYSQGEFIWRAEVDEILPGVGITERNHTGEVLSRGTLINKLKIDLGALEPRAQYALTNYITYGSPDTYKLGWGERAGVLNSFMAAFGKVPETVEDWQDIIKIANGRWPTQRSEEAETAANEHFRKIYLREPDRSNPRDDAAVTVIAYGLRPANRNFDSEKTAIKTFKHIYGYNPEGATDWDIVRAVAYSGAIR